MLTLTQEELKKYVNYDPETGVFTRKVARGGRKVGDVAGALNWKGYLLFSINDTPYRAHRMAWLYVYGGMPKDQIDHINGVKTDNRICNLREASNTENCRNVRVGKNNTSGVTGVSWHTRDSCWEAQIMVNRKTIKLGKFHRFEDAVQCRQEAEAHYFKEFVRVL